MRSTPLDTEAAGAAPPDAFGPFRVLHQVGAGTLGPVFRAYEPEQDRLVAVKLYQLDLPPERVLPFVARLQALIDADLAHPAIAAPILAGIVDGTPFLAQDFVAADSLDTIVREFGGAPAADAARVATQLAGALDFAAAVGVFHGALHPRDILLASDDARLTGLGISQAQESAGMVPLVRRPYAAPERVAGAEWDRRADVYSLAVVIAEMITGRRPASAAALDGLFAATDIPAAARAVFGRAMAERPDDRFETALAFADALKQVIDGGVVSMAAPIREVTLSSTLSAVVPPPLPSVTPTLPLDLPVERRLPIDEPLRGAMPELLPGDLPPGVADDPTDRAILADAELTRADDTADWDLRPPDVVTSAAPMATEAAASPTLPGLAAAAVTSAAAPAVVPSPPASSSVWPIPVALLVGVIVGIAIGFFVFANRAGEPETLSALPAATPSVPAAALPAAPPTASAQPTASVAPPAPAATPASPAVANPAPPAAPPALPASPAAPAPPAERVAVRPPERRRLEQPARAATATGGGRVLVRSSPAGARVLLNGRDVGTTPTTLRTLPLGTHTLRLTRDGYAAEERRVTVSASQPAQSIVVDLARTRPASAAAATMAARFTAALTVESRPPGATVFVDGRRIGTTPLTVASVEAGSHVVRLELDGYRLWSSAVRVTSGERNRVTASLEQ